MQPDRFLETYVQRGLMGPTFKVLVDRKTGVNYLFVQNGNQGAALTPLLDENGKPVVTPIQ